MESEVFLFFRRGGDLLNDILGILRERKKWVFTWLFFR